MPRRYLVQWTETVTHLDIAFVTDEEVRAGLDYSHETWAAFTDADRDRCARAYLNARRDVDELGGSRRWKTTAHSGFDVTGSAPWLPDAEEPQL